MRALALLISLAMPAKAEVLPALHSVIGVASNDVLNVRAGPDAGTEILAVISPDATGIEVLALSPDGAWAQVNLAETTGWVATRFLARQPGPDWTALQTPLACYGTEPFWSLTLDPAAGTAGFDAPEFGARSLRIDWATTAMDGSRVAGFQMSGADGPGFATVAAGWCSDGMSDREMGLSVTYFVMSESGSQGFLGCCVLAP